MEALRTLELYAKENNWRLFMTRKADEAFLAFKQKVLERDQYTCQFCGFQSQFHLEIVNFDHNYHNNRLKNLISACPLCVQCCFLETVGKTEWGGGVLIYLPEMQQNALNALCHILFAKIVDGTDSFEKTARNIYRSLRLRSQIVEKELGEGLSNPAFCGQMLIDSTLNDKPAFLKSFNMKIRLLPDMNKFPVQLDHWMIMGLQALIYT